MSEKQERAGVQTVTEARALAAMANPWRSRILDILSVEGPATASQLAGRTGLAVGSASHHLKVLDEAGLVEEAAELARDRRERWWRLVTPSVRWSRTEFADDAGAVAAAVAAEALGLQRQFERSRDWLASDDEAEEWLSAAFATQSWLKLTPAELTSFSEELLALVRQWKDRTGEAADPARRRAILSSPVGSQPIHDHRLSN